MRLLGFGKLTEIDNGCKINRFVMVEKYDYYVIRDREERRNILMMDTGNEKLNKKIGELALEEIEKYYCPNHE